MDDKHKKVVKATAKEIVKKFLENMNAQRKAEQSQAIFSEFPIEGLPNVIIEDQTYVHSSSAAAGNQSKRSKIPF